MKTIKNYIQQKYYIYQRGEFFPVYSAGTLSNKREFHYYKIKQLLKTTDLAICRAVNTTFSQ